MGPSTIASSVLPPNSKAPDTMVDGTALPSVCCTQASIYISHLHACELAGIRPSQWYSLKRDSSAKTQCLQWPRSQSRCHCVHCRRRLLCSIGSLGHLAGLREAYPPVKCHRLVVRTYIWRPIRQLNSSPNQGLVWTGCSAPLSAEPSLLEHLATFGDVAKSLDRGSGLPEPVQNHADCALW